MEIDSTNSQETIDSTTSGSINVIRENTTEILVPPGKKVFYNPVQEFNRDLSVLALQVLSKKLQSKNENKETENSFRILEALSATGLRSIRYAKEIPNVSEVIANDFCEEAVKSIKANIKHNNVENIVTPSQSDAVALMFESIPIKKRFHAIDLDPYGSPSQFLDTAVQSVVDGGILLVTCTDTSVLCGVYPETSFAKYGALSLKSQGIHEMAIRIVLQSIQSHAAKYKRYIVPLLSVSVDFYIRVIVQVNTSAAACKEVFSKLSMVYECCGCGAKVFQPLGKVKKSEDKKKTQYIIPHLPNLGGRCVHCGGSQRMGGPIWNDPIHDLEFVNELLEANEKNDLGTSKRLLGMLTLVKEELQDVPLYYSAASLCKVLKCSEMPLLKLRSAILNANYRVSQTHANKNGIKTDAPMDLIWDIFKSWAKTNFSKSNKLQPGSPGDVLLNSPIKHDIDFTERADANPLSRKIGLLRYQENPAPHWGPGTKSTTRVKGEPNVMKTKKPVDEETSSPKKMKSEEQ